MLSAAMASVPAFDPTETETDINNAREASRALGRLAGRGAVQVEATAKNEPRQSFVLPAQAVRLLMDMLAHLAEGRMVAVFPDDAELSTQQAAEMLGISRPYLIQLLEEGKLSYYKVGTHRRVRFRDVVTYRETRSHRQQEALNELTAQAQELGLGY